MNKKPTHEEPAQKGKDSGKEPSRHRQVCGRSLAVFLAIFFLTFGVSAVNCTELDHSLANGQDVAPADVFSAVQVINTDLGLLREHMGRPKATILNIRVYDAAPHDVYFQALTLFRKANRLSFEITRLQEQAPPMPEKLILPADVLVLVKSAHRSIHKVMNHLNLQVNHDRQVRHKNKTPTDVFRDILRTNRQLNQLLERRFDPSDVYMEVTLAIGYADCQLAQYPFAIRIPDEALFEKGKRPSHVYFRLLECLQIISNIYKELSLKTLVIDSAHIDEKNITPSDVLDVALLVVARLDFLKRHNGLSKMPIEAFYPGRKYPSDVYQQAGILLEQLKQLERFITVKEDSQEPGIGNIR